MRTSLRPLVAASVAAVLLSATLALAAPAPVSAATSARSRRVAELRRARAVLAGLKSRYRHLDGVTVALGRTPGGYQAVSYYTAGRIVISTKHRASIERILKHEIWHIIDWRDNGRIDWMENVPPSNAASYRR